MINPNLSSAPDTVRKIILDQASSRLESQCAFAASQDSRAVTLISASASLAAASAGIAIAAASGDRLALAWAASVATIGFVVTAGASLYSLRSRGFHSKGWYPHDFLDDLAAGKDAAAIETDIIEDLEIRLRHNAKVLSERGRVFNLAAIVIALTPICALVAGLLANSHG